MKKGCIALLALTASVAAAELTLRLIAPIRTVGIQKAYQYDPELGYRLKPGIHLLETTDHQEEVRVNRQGTVNFQEDFASYGAPIFALGDSYTAGTGLPADAAYPFQLDLILNRDQRGLYSRRYAVVNLGLAAFGGEQSLIALRRYTAHLGKPSIVLYLGSENDYTDDVLFKSGSRHRHLVEGNPYWGRMLPLARWAGGTELGKRLKVAAATPRRPREADGAPAGGGGPAKSVAELEQPVLEKIAAQCGEYGAVLVVSWSAAPSPSYDWLKSWAAGKGIAFADWSPAVESVRSSIPAVPIENPHSGGHLRGWVMRMVAEAFARQIQARSPGT